MQGSCLFWYKDLRDRLPFHVYSHHIITQLTEHPAILQPLASGRGAVTRHPRSSIDISLCDLSFSVGGARHRSESVLVLLLPVKCQATGKSGHMAPGFLSQIVLQNTTRIRIDGGRGLKEKRARALSFCSRLLLDQRCSES